MPEPPPVTPAQSSTSSTQRHRRPRRPLGETQNPGTRGSTGEGQESNKNEESASRPRRPRIPKPRDGLAGEPSTARSNGATTPAGSSGERRDKKGGQMNQDTPNSGAFGRYRRPPPRGQTGAPLDTVHSTEKIAAPNADAPTAAHAPTKRSRNRRKFHGELTEGGSLAEPADPSREKYRHIAPKADDLTTRLTNELGTPPYPDCLICFAPMTPMQPTWSCSPSHPTVIDIESGSPENAHAERSAQCCWMTFHLRCIGSWAKKNVKDVEDACRVRGEVRQGDWRCPGCQLKRTAIPSSYWCFCGSTPDPRPPRLATPHSCANPCTRAKGCEHPCSLNCHPGPCPPCQVTTSKPCYCGKEVMSFRCSHRGTGILASAELSCSKPCGRPLGCGKHICQDTCHPGKCNPCLILEKARCYCGKEERELGCGEGEGKESLVLQDEKVEQWLGLFPCEQTCERMFDCGIHRCKKSCHPPSLTPAPCPHSPAVVKHCPCGKYGLIPESAPFFPPGTLLTRSSCKDPVPTCASTCIRPLEGCEHVCSAKCHTGPCPPCSIVLVRPCRCGSASLYVRCFKEQARARARARGDTGPDTEILCERPCGALRACGRHQCTRICCPLASLAGPSKARGKKRIGADPVGIVDQEGWHECDLVCGKTLNCGIHHCEQRDHKGACPPCLRSSFEEMVCYCGHTILEPPIPCGTRLVCGYPCSRPPPECGHPKAQHACHGDNISCPPCPYLTSKQCACGKKVVDNVRCSQEKVSCGTTCGKLLLSCGFHHCDRLCHGDACGACHAPCGKPRKLCLPAQHPCPLPCHAPASCDESEACRSIVTITCTCGRIRQQISCGRSMSNPAGREGSQQLKCTNECAVAKRNARLAEALGISPDRADGRTQQVTYGDELVAFARANAKFCTLVEKSFTDFLSSDKKIQILPPMPEPKRRFVHGLAAVYRMDVQMVDQEPHRSVQLLRRIDSRIPTPLLSATVGGASSGSPGLGKLADFRASGSGLQPLSRPGSSSGSRVVAPTAQPFTGSSSGRGWTSVVARPVQLASPAPSAWGPPIEQAKTPVRPVPSPQPVRTTAVPVPAVEPQDVPEDWEDAA